VAGHRERSLVLLTCAHHGSPKKADPMFSSNFRFLLTEGLPKATAVNAYRWETSGVVATRWRLIAKTINRKSGLFL
jgi:hypothetical protein